MNAPALVALQNGLTDTELARRVAADDEGALELLMRRYNQTLYRTARSILKDDAEAEDAVQEAYLLACRSIDRYRGEARLSTWLVRIVVNESLARLRRRTRRIEVIELGGAGGNEPMDGPEHAVARREVRRLLEAKIDALPDAFRTVFVLRGIEDFTVEEAAESLGIPEATVRTRYFRARGMLREAIEREVDGACYETFSFAGDRCDRIVANVLARLRAEKKTGT